MKKNLIYILIIALAIIVYQLLNPQTVLQTVSEYKEGKPDSSLVLKLDSLKALNDSLSFAVNNIKTKVYYDTVYLNDSTISVTSDSSQIYSSNFNIELEDSASVSGIVSFEKSKTKAHFTFKELSAKYIYKEIYITQVDTLTETNVTEKPQPFYDSFEFGFGTGVFITIAAVIIFGGK